LQTYGPLPEMFDRKALFWPAISYVWKLLH
jgi:hypothetical protein